MSATTQAIARVNRYTSVFPFAQLSTPVFFGAPKRIIRATFVFESVDA
jgi:hypothetical protein